MAADDTLGPDTSMFEIKPASKQIVKKKEERRTTRGVKLGNMNENALAKKSSLTDGQQSKKPQKQNDKQLRKQFDSGNAYDDDKDDRDA